MLEIHTIETALLNYAISFLSEHVGEVQIRASHFTAILSIINIKIQIPNDEKISRGDGVYLIQELRKVHLKHVLLSICSRLTMEGGG